MEFCPKCGSILMMKKSKFGCPRCSYVSKENISLKVSEEIKKTASVAVVSEKETESTHPITDHTCDKCGNKKAYFWTRQMRSGDEPESRFYKCVKCKVTVRED
jgi:transcription factor S